MDTAKPENNVVNDPEKVESRKRTNAIVIVEILLRPEQINDFKNRLELLKREFMNALD